ncbi:DUF6879 family protein [Acidithrix ferrooxidans]|uniref:DUF6879 domain-containing protein n=1 Tax=Acidithrix ferrooxidans TaxID=1280514 RepID=A0A0D8HG71_9ACTN|nr:DUF6879 family protein [Acidithrix ferrooxidans]KJF16965.1 hypothetical protein AXFE_21670 [Acidithrix ferrooxidans]
MDLEALFVNFQSSAFRLEGLPTYRVPGEDLAFASFLKQGTIPAGFNAPWVALVEDFLAEGKTVNRLRLLSESLTDYESFEVQAYEAGLRVGEKIRVAPRIDCAYESDFWFFDGKWIAWMNYLSDGSFQGAEVSTASASEIKVVEQWLRVFENSPNLRDVYACTHQA